MSLFIIIGCGFAGKCQMNRNMNRKKILMASWLKDGLRRLYLRIGFETILLCSLACVPVASARLSQYAIDEVITARSMENLSRLLLMSLAFMGIVLAFKYTVAWISATTRQKFAFHVRNLLWGRWVKGLDDEQRYQAGDVANRLLGDMYSAGDIAITLISTVLVCAGSLCVYLIMLFRYNMILALISLLFIPVYMILYVLLGRRIQTSTFALRTSLDHVMNFIVFRWEHLDEIRTLQGTLMEQKNFNVVSDGQFHTGLRMLFIKNLSSGIVEVVMVGWNLMLFTAGAFFVLRSTITLGELIAVQMMASQIVGPIQQFLNLNLSIKAAQVSVERVSEIDAQCQTVQYDNTHGAEGLCYEPLVGGSFELLNVLCYSDRDAIDIPPLNLKIPVLERVYLEGKNGSGKSSVCRVLAGVRKPAVGVVQYENETTFHRDIKYFQSHVFLLTHMPFFFSGTIRDNLIYGLTELPDDAKLLEVLRRVGLGDWVEALPGGLDFRIKDGGINLSNGQRQRLHCARCILRPHEVVIVDEAMSGIDDLDSECILREMNCGRNLIITRIGRSENLMVVKK